MYTHTHTHVTDAHTRDGCTHAHAHTQLFLGCLPEEQSEWEESCRISRSHFERLKKEYITDPYMASASLDVAVNNPLSQAETVSLMTIP